MTDPPANDEFEVSIFGPGKGECIVVHLGAGRWIVVDSCRDQRTGEVAALKYLDGLGVDLATEIHAVVATHAHDDHFDGIADIVEKCQTARIVTSQALINREFLAQVQADRDIAGVSKTSAYREYRRIFEIAEQRKDRLSGFRPLMRANENKVLLNLGAVGSVPPAMVTALSPSEHAVTRAQSVLANNMLHAMGERSRRSVLDPNEASIALWVTSGPVNILLGADLLSGPSGCGWGAVLQSFTPPQPATLYKAAHHGSSTSHHDGLWQKLLADDPLVLLAPFRHGNVDLPKDTDVAYLLSHTGEAWTTSPRRPTPNAAIQRQRAKLGRLAQKVRDPYGLVGQVRARVPLAGGTWSVASASPAARLTKRP